MICIYTVCKGRVYLGSAGQGLKNNKINYDVNFFDAAKCNESTA